MSSTPCLGQLFLTLNYPEYVSDKLHGKFLAMEGGTMSCGHLVWAIPANVFVNVATFLLAPIIALIQYLAAAVFALFACCSAQAKGYAVFFFIAATRALFDTPIIAVMRIFAPTVKVTIQCARDAASSCITKCCGSESS